MKVPSPTVPGESSGSTLERYDQKRDIRGCVRKLPKASLWKGESESEFCSSGELESQKGFADS